MSHFELHQGDNLAVLRGMPDNSIDSICTDPPYGLSSEPDMLDVLRHWMAGDDYTHGGTGFMGKAWDSFVPGPAIWRECLRVLKPGGHVLAFSGTRTYDMAVLAMRLAGFEIRDQFAWVYGSGMPKSRDLGDGWGTAAKPAWEPIVLARKPFRGTVAANVLKHGTGGLNIDGCRIDAPDGKAPGGAGVLWSHLRDGKPGKPPASRDGEASADRRYTERGGTNFAMKPGPRGGDPAGRWPANLLHDGSDEVLAGFPDAPGQSGAITGDEPTANGFTGNVYGAPGTAKRAAAEPRGDTGSAARFFYCGKASTAEREAGLEDLPERILARGCGAQADVKRGNADERVGAAFNSISKRKNHHPTVKPIAVMRWLQRLITPAGGVTLDLYAGSGTAGMAAILEGFRPILIELDRDGDGKPLGYEAIIRARCAWAVQEAARERRARLDAERLAADKAAQLDIFAAVA